MASCLRGVLFVRDTRKGRTLRRIYTAAMNRRFKLQAMLLSCSEMKTMRSSGDSHSSLYQKLHDIDFPIFIGSDGRPALVLGEKPDYPKLIIVSVPRSGTHFTARLAAALGFVFAGLHLSPDGTAGSLQDRRFMRPAGEDFDIWKTYEMGLSDVLLMLRPGQFVQGHIPFSSDMVSVLRGTKLIYPVRNLRNVVISGMRFIADLHKRGTKFAAHLDQSWCDTTDGPEKVIRYLKSFGEGLPKLIEKISPWRNLPETFEFDFDRIGTTRERIDDSTDHLAALANFLEIETSDEKITKILALVFEQGSATWTGQLSDYRQYWSESVEEAFQSLGLGDYSITSAPMSVTAEVEAQVNAGESPSGNRPRVSEEPGPAILQPAGLSPAAASSESSASALRPLGFRLIESHKSVDPPPGRRSTAFPPGGGRYLLDLVPGASAAFGLRRLSQPNDGPIIRLRGSTSREGVEFGTVQDGALNVRAIAEAFCDSSATCVEWIDQSQYSNSATAGMTGPMYVCPSIHTGPMMRFGPLVLLRSLVSLEGLTGFSIFAFFRAASIANATSIARWQKAGAFVVFPYHTGDVIVGIDGGVAGGVPLGIVPGEFSVHGVVWKRGATDGFATYRNGSIVAQRRAANTPIGVGGEPLFVGSYDGQREPFAGDLVELIIWPRALADDEVRVVSENMRQAFALP